MIYKKFCFLFIIIFSVNPVFSDENNYFLKLLEIGEIKSINTALSKDNSVINTTDHRGRYPIHYSAMLPQKNCSEILLNNKADINCIDTDGNTPLHYASEYGGTETLEFLIEHGANTTLTNNEGKDSLDLAISRGQLKQVKIILKYYDNDLNYDHIDAAIKNIPGNNLINTADRVCIAAEIGKKLSDPIKASYIDKNTTDNKIISYILGTSPNTDSVALESIKCAEWSSDVDLVDAAIILQDEAFIKELVKTDFVKNNITRYIDASINYRRYSSFNTLRESCLSTPLVYSKLLHEFSHRERSCYWESSSSFRMKGLDYCYSYAPNIINGKINFHLNDEEFIFENISYWNYYSFLMFFENRDYIKNIKVDNRTEIVDMQLHNGVWIGPLDRFKQYKESQFPLLSNSFSEVISADKQANKDVVVIDENSISVYREGMLLLGPEEFEQKPKSGIIDGWGRVIWGSKNNSQMFYTENGDIFISEANTELAKRKFTEPIFYRYNKYADYDIFYSDQQFKSQIQYFSVLWDFAENRKLIQISRADYAKTFISEDGELLPFFSQSSKRYPKFRLNVNGQPVLITNGDKVSIGGLNYQVEVKNFTYIEDFRTDVAGILESADGIFYLIDKEFNKLSMWSHIYEKPQYINDEMYILAKDFDDEYYLLDSNLNRTGPFGTPPNSLTFINGRERSAFYALDKTDDGFVLYKNDSVVTEFTGGKIIAIEILEQAGIIRMLNMVSPERTELRLTTIILDE